MISVSATLAALRTSFLPGAFLTAVLAAAAPDESPVHHWRTVNVPPALRATHAVDGQELTYGGDIRIGDLLGNGRMAFLVYRAEYHGQKDGGTKPVFLGAFDQAGKEIWHQGEGGYQPARPLAVALHDIDGDGHTEIIHFWKDPRFSAPDYSLGDVAIQIRDGASGKLKKEATPATLPEDFRTQTGKGANFIHQRILICNLRGLPTPRDFVVKAGNRIFAFDENLGLLWSYVVPFNQRPNHTAYIPAIGDIDGDGRDEVSGGRYLVDDDGTALFEDTSGRITPHMDSVAITPWDDGRMRVLASGGGHVLDAKGQPVLSLGEKLVPHGQEARIAKFIEGSDERQMVIRWSGHGPKVMLVDVRGQILQRFDLNRSPNNTGMEVVHWNGPDRAAVLYNGGMLWQPASARSAPLPGLPPLVGPNRMGWYHCIPADLDGDGREEIVVYNPWDDEVHIFGPTAAPNLPARGYVAGPRQYNARLMD